MAKKICKTKSCKAPHASQDFSWFRKHVNVHGHKFVFGGILSIAAIQAVNGVVLKSLLVKIFLIAFASFGIYKAVDTTIALPPAPIGDTTAPVVSSIVYSPSTLTSGDVVATIAFDDLSYIYDVQGNFLTSQPVQGYSYIFTNNGSAILNIVNSSSLSTSVDLQVSWIDKIAPTAVVEYQTLTVSNKNVTVIALLTGSSEPITITNNGGLITYTFTQNGSFTFEFMDAVGNTGSAIATVDSLGKTVCNQGIGNGLENCDPGNSQPHGSSNDEGDYHNKESKKDNIHGSDLVVENKSEFVQKYEEPKKAEELQRVGEKRDTVKVENPASFNNWLSTKFLQFSKMFIEK